MRPIGPSSKLWAKVDRLQLRMTARRLGLRRATNSEAWAIGDVTASGQFRIRRIVWGLTLARAERRDGEEIRKALVLVGEKRKCGRVTTFEGG